MTDHPASHTETNGIIPATIPIFPLPDVLLLPGGDLPLNIFEPRYRAMIDYARANDGLIGMIQPCVSTNKLCLDQIEEAVRPFYTVGCVGKITDCAETADNRYLVNLHGVVRFRLMSHHLCSGGYRMAHIDSSAFLTDMHAPKELPECMTRQCLMDKFQEYLAREELHVDWDMAGAIPDYRFYTLLAMICPFSSAEKQALLEATDFEERCRMMKCMMEIACAEDENALPLSGKPC